MEPVNGDLDRVFCFLSITIVHFWRTVILNVNSNGEGAIR